MMKPRKNSTKKRKKKPESTHQTGDFDHETSISEFNVEK